MSDFRVSMEVKDPSSVRATSPFKVSSEDGRRFIRMDFSKTVEFALIKDGNAFFSNSDQQKRRGVALNISVGGALIETDELAPEGSVISVDLVVADEVHLSEVLAVIKRVDQVDETVVLGVEFISHERLTDLLSKPEMELLNDKFGYFPARLHAMLRNHLEVAD